MPFRPSLRNIGRVGQVRPAGSLPTIDWNHPLTNGLLFYGYDSVATAGWNDNTSGGSGTSAPIVDLVTGAVAFRMGTGSFTSPTTVGTQFGPAYQYNVNNGNNLAISLVNGTAIKNAQAGNWTYACAFIKTGSVGTFSRPFGRTANNGGSAPFMNWDFEVNPNGRGQGVINANVCTSAAAFSSAPDATISDNTYTTALATTSGSNPASQTLSLYINGALTGSVGGLAAFSSNANDPIMFGGSSGASIANPFLGEVFWGAFWSRALTADEILTLHLDPYCFLLSDYKIEFVDQVETPLTATGVSATGSVGTLSIPSILFAGQEDLSFVGINSPITTNSANGIVINSSQTSGQFRSEYARYSINIPSGLFNTVAGNTFLIRTAQAFSATSFWTSGRIWASAGAIPTSGFPFMRWCDSNGVVRLLIQTASNSGSILGVYKVNAAGTQTQLGANTPSGVSAAPTVPDKIDVYINYSSGGNFQLHINGTRVFSYSGDLTTDGNASLSYVDYGMAVGSSTLLTANNHWSECIVARTDTRQMSLLTQTATTSGNSTTFTSGAASRVNAITVSPTSPDYSSSAGQVQQYQIDGSQSLATTDASYSNVTLLVHADGTNASTNFYDVSSSNVGLTSTNAVVSTSTPKFGSGAVSIPSASSYITTNNLAAFQFGSGQFTVEGWGYLTAFSSSTFYIFLGNYQGSSNLGWGFGFDNSGRLAFYYSTTGSDNLNVGATYTPSINTWIHFAVDRDASNAVRVYANGAVIAGPTTVASTLFASPTNWLIGNDNNHTRGWVGQIDEVRVTKGLARYGGAFTPSSSPFPNFGPGSSIVSVVQHAQCAASSTGPQHVEFNVRTGGTDYFTTDLSPGTGWSLVSYNWDFNPNTSIAWQMTDLPASSSFNFGYKSTT